MLRVDAIMLTVNVIGKGLPLRNLIKSEQRSIQLNSTIAKEVTCTAEMGQQ